jgi:DNA polymerase
MIINGKATLTNNMERLNPHGLLRRLAAQKVKPDAFHGMLLTHGCSGCNLGFQEQAHGPVFYRGDVNSKWAIIGEALGETEVELRLPFQGPAGKLLDQMLGFLNVPWEPLISNVCLCRPIAPAGSGRQNLTPTEEQLSACRPYISYLLNWVQPDLVVLCGGTAVKSLLPKFAGEKIGDLVGQFIISEEFEGILFTVLYHPAFLLRKKNNPIIYKPYQEKTVDALNRIKEVLKEIYETEETSAS